MVYLRGGLQVRYSLLQQTHVHVLEGFTGVHYFLDGLMVSFYHGQTFLTAMCEGRQLLQHEITVKASGIHSFYVAFS